MALGLSEFSDKVLPNVTVFATVMLGFLLAGERLHEF
jgi:hypothetical protein